MHLLHRLHQDDRGLTLVELMITTLLLTIVSIVFSGILSSTMNATANLDGAARSNDDVRIALFQIDKDVRSAEQICEPVNGDGSDTLTIKIKTFAGVETITYTVVFIPKYIVLYLEAVPSYHWFHWHVLMTQLFVIYTPFSKFIHIISGVISPALYGSRRKELDN